VTEPPRHQTVLVVEDDLGFLLWLGQLLTDAGYRVVPASNCRQVMAHIRKLGVSLNLIVVNPSIRGAMRMLEGFAPEKSRIRLILIRDLGMDLPGVGPASATIEKPRSWERISRQEWMQRIRQALTEAPSLASMAATTSRW
jgi:hypothetical protein